MSNSVFAGIPALLQIAEVARRAKVEAEPAFRDGDRHYPRRLYLKPRPSRSVGRGGEVRRGVPRTGLPRRNKAAASKICGKLLYPAYYL